MRFQMSMLQALVVMMLFAESKNKLFWFFVVEVAPPKVFHVGGTRYYKLLISIMFGQQPNYIFCVKVRPRKIFINGSTETL